MRKLRILGVLFFVVVFIFLLATGLEDTEQDKIRFGKQSTYTFCAPNMWCANFDPVAGIFAHSLQMRNLTLTKFQNNIEYQNHIFQGATFSETSRFCRGYSDGESSSSAYRGPNPDTGKHKANRPHAENVEKIRTHP